MFWGCFPLFSYDEKPDQQDGQVQMRAWHRFEQSGTIEDYMRYRNTVAAEETMVNVNQNRRIGSQTTEYR